MGLIAAKHHHHHSREQRSINQSIDVQTKYWNPVYCFPDFLVFVSFGPLFSLVFADLVVLVTAVLFDFSTSLDFVVVLVLDPVLAGVSSFSFAALIVRGLTNGQRHFEDTQSTPLQRQIGRG